MRTAGASANVRLKVTSAKMYSKEFVTKIKEEVIRTHGLKKWKKFRGTD
jgi:hypothetical protein